MISLREEAPGLIVLRFTAPAEPGDEAGYLDALERIGAQAAPFVLMTVFAGHDRLSPAGERGQALWYKRTRETMNHHCRALALVRPGEPGRSAEVFGKLWTFPVAPFAEEDAARDFLAGYQP